MALAAVLAQPQTKPAARLQFEVASIKPSTGCGDGGRGTGVGSGSSPGRLYLDCRTVMSLIRMAYVNFANGKRVPSQAWTVPIQGAPAWIDSDYFTIDAKAEGPQNDGTMRGPMMQSLLEDRFKLRIRRETKEIPVYALTVSQGAPKLPRFKEGTCTPLDLTQPPLPSLDQGIRYCPLVIGAITGPNLTVNVEGMSVDDFCRNVLRRMDRAVIDKTGLKGLFDFHLTYVADEASDRLLRQDFDSGEPSDEPPGPSIFTALRELGLKLEPAKGAGVILVIDHVEKPTDN